MFHVIPFEKNWLYLNKICIFISKPLRGRYVATLKIIQQKHSERDFISQLYSVRDGLFSFVALFSELLLKCGYFRPYKILLN